VPTTVTEDNEESLQLEEPLITTPAECLSTDKDQDSDDLTGSLEVSFCYRYAMSIVLSADL